MKYFYAGWFFLSLYLILLTWAFFYSQKAYSLDLNLKYGVGFGATDSQNMSEVKYLSLGIQGPISSLFRAKFDVGAWFDSKEGSTGRKSSSFGSAAIGYRVEPGYFYVENYFGTALIEHPDSQLGIPFEFTEEFGFGVKDNRGRSTGIQWKHFSNAGISPINKGRDFILVNIGIPL